jgi:hypothetical protein
MPNGDKLVVDTLSLRLQQILFAYWHIPAREGRVLLHALQHSSCARVVTLRHHLGLAQTGFHTQQGTRHFDLDHLFVHILTPTFVIAMVEDLHAVKALSPHERTTIEEAVLGCVTAEGAWKAV